MEPNDEDTYTVSHPGRKLTLVGIGMVVLIAALAYAAGNMGGYQERSRDAATGMSGKVEDLASGEGTSGVSAEVLINELEDALGGGDGRELIGRHVNLRVTLAEPIGVANASGRFWVNTQNGPLLVVLARDNRDAIQRIEGLPADNPAQAAGSGLQIAISGRIIALPHAEQRWGWGLTSDELETLTARPIYIRGESVKVVS